MNYEHTITFDGDYFAHKVKNDYVDWKFAWGREAGQNSLDAGATDINVMTVVDGEGNTKVTWVDNGCGMSRETLVNKFMAVGGSDKPNGGTGGFGVAKIILAFAHKQYSIRTRDFEAIGSGARYGIKDGLPSINGLILRVTMDGDVKDDLDSRIKKWCKFSSTKANIVLNGDVLETLKLHRPKLTTDWCKVYTYKDAGWGYEARVRINGQYMFNVYTSVDTHVIVDLNGTKSTDYFTSNRDSLNSEWRSKLQKLLEEIYENPKAIKEDDEQINLYSGTDGRVVLERRKPTRKAALSATPTIGTGSKNDSSMDGYKPSLPQQSMLAPELRGKTEYRKVEELIDGFDVAVVNCTSKAIPQKWIPGHMNGSIGKLLNRWVRVLQVCGLILERTEEFTPGWIFSKDTRAQYRHNPEYGHMIQLNPVDILETKFKNHWKNDVGSFYEMVAVAVHELTHIDQRNHNNGFARDITYSLGKVMAQQGLLEIIRKETA